MKSSVKTIVIGIMLAFSATGCGVGISQTLAPPTVNAQVTPQTAQPLDLNGLLAALQTSGATIESGNNVSVEQPFFSVPGRVITVNGFEIQVFEYADHTSAAAQSALIMPDGSVGTSMITWVDTPHFYAQGRLIVLYVGNDASVLAALQSALGAPLAQGAAGGGGGLPSPEGVPQDPAANLIAALNNRDFAQIESMLGDTFSVGYWLSEGASFTPDQAIVQLDSLLPPAGGLTYTTNPADFPDLGGIDPARMLGPDVAIEEVVFSTGWGQDGSQEAFLLFSNEADGTFVWLGMLYGRFDVQALPPPDMTYFPEPQPGDELTAWDSLLDENLTADTQRTSLTYTLIAGESGATQTYTLSYPADWSIIEGGAHPGYLMLQNDPAPSLNHGIPAETFVKLDMVLLDQPPTINPADALMPEAFDTVTAAGQLGVLYIDPREYAQSDIASRTIALVFQREGKWVSVSGRITIPGGDSAALEYQTQLLLSVFSSLAVG